MQVHLGNTAGQLRKLSLVRPAKTMEVTKRTDEMRFSDTSVEKLFYRSMEKNDSLAIHMSDMTFDNCNVQ